MTGIPNSAMIMILLMHVISIFLNAVSVRSLICVSAEFHIMEGVWCATWNGWESTVHGNTSNYVYTALP